MTAVPEKEQSLPADWYTKPEAFSREKRKVFTEAWLLLCRSDQLGQAGNYVALGIAGWPVVAMADATGAAHVFRNVCRHQGLPIFDSGSGHCELVRCRYHGWTYDLSGRFVEAPPTVAPADPNDPIHHLDPVAFVERDGLLYVHLGRGRVPAPEVLIDPTIRFDALRFRQEHAVEIMANWKLAVERQLASPLSAGATRSWCWPNLIVDVAETGAVVSQLVPRAFQRTRVVRHLYARPEIDEARLAAWVAAEAQAAQAQKAEAEADHTALHTGSSRPQELGPAVLPFYERLRALYGATAE